jgi:hypothetical protein
MWAARLSTLSLLALGVGGLALPAADEADRLARLVTELGSPSYRQREAAGRELDALDEAALPALRHAAAGPDAEARHRAAELVARIEHRAQVRRVLAPTTVQLSFQDTPVADAVAELSRQSGYPLTVGHTLPPGRRVTLQTGKVPFWEAFDRLCQAAGLAEPGASLTVPSPVRTLTQRAAAGVVLRGGVAAPTEGNALTAAPPPIVLEDRPTDRPASYVAGALRLRAWVPAAAPGQAVRADEIGLSVEAAPEPRLSWQRLLGVVIDRALDDRGQLLAAVPPAPEPVSSSVQRVVVMGNGQRVMFNRVMSGGAAVPLGVRQKLVALKKGPEASRRLAEVSGTVIAEVRTPAEELVAVENALKAEGRPVAGRLGTSLRVAAVGRDHNEHYLLRVTVHHPADVQADRIARPVGGDPGVLREMAGLTVTDAAGKRYGLSCLDVESSANGASFVHTFTLCCHPAEKDQGDPARVAFVASRPVVIAVPFTVRDVPCP